ncbi:MAG: hypothetical protein JNJ45_00240 [Chthonomonas sp.]|nr:hypothetical protein [Chthonomonas sp.]
MQRLPFFASLVAAAMLIGCATSKPMPGPKAKFVIKNNSGRDLMVMPASLTNLAEPAAAKPEEMAMFSDTSLNFVPMPSLMVLEGGADADQNLVGLIRFSSDEMANAELAGPVKISLEPNKIFVKWGSRGKVYDYLAKPKVAGELTVPEAKAAETTEKK